MTTTPSPTPITPTPSPMSSELTPTPTQISIPLLNQMLAERKAERKALLEDFHAFLIGLNLVRPDIMQQGSEAVGVGGSSVARGIYTEPNKPPPKSAMQWPAVTSSIFQTNLRECGKSHQRTSKSCEDAAAVLQTIPLDELLALAKMLMEI